MSTTNILREYEQLLERVASYEKRMIEVGLPFGNEKTKPLLERIIELEAALTHCIGTLERTMYANTPNDIQEAIDHAKSVRYKKDAAS